MTNLQEEKLLDQCFLLYKQWALGRMDSEEASMLWIELWDILDDIDHKRTKETFANALGMKSGKDPFTV